MTFSLNSTFDSYKEFETLKQQYQNEHFTQFSIVKSDKYPLGHKYFHSLLYKRVHFECKYGKKIRQSQATIRTASSYKQNCPFKLILKAAKGKLVVRHFNEIHNGHPKSENDFKKLPEQRRLSPEETEEAVKFLRLKSSNRKELQKFMIEKTHKAVQLTDIHRIASKVKSKTTNDIKDLIEALCSIKNSVVEVTEDDNGDMLGVYFQDKNMMTHFENYPELLLLDSKYNLLNSGTPVILLMVIDGSGESQICCLWITKDKNLQTMDSMFNSFKKYNSKWASTKMLVITGEMINLDYFHTFPTYTCYNVYDVLRRFKKEITEENCNISEDERKIVIKMLESLIWAKTEDEYFEIYEDLRALNMSKVLEYFDKNWHTKYKHWALFSKRHYFNYFNKKTSFCQHFTHKLRDFLAAYFQLQPFFSDIIGCSKESNSNELSVNITKENTLSSTKKTEHLHEVVSEIVKEGEKEEVFNEETVDDEVFKQVVNDLYDSLTAFAYNLVIGQLKAQSSVKFLEFAADGPVVKCQDGDKTIETSSTQCQCDFRTVMKLPCQHIFAYRIKAGMKPVFYHSLCAKRWLQPYLKTENDQEKLQTPSELTLRGKQKKVKTLVSKLSVALSRQPVHLFEHYSEQCEKFINFVIAGDLVSVVPEMKLKPNLNNLSVVRNSESLATLLKRIKFPSQLTKGAEDENDLANDDSGEESEPRKKKLKKN